MHLKLISSGGMAKMGGYMPQRLALSAEQPTGIVKLPAHLVAPLFGALKIGVGDAATAIFVVLDEPDGLPSRLFVDANANGDLTDDPAPVWTARPVKGRDGATYAQFSGSAKVSASLGGVQAMLGLSMYRFDKRDPARAAMNGGDTGLIIATAGLRGPALEKTIAAVLAKRLGR
ncbi:MAG: hypothetical protein EXS37_08270 [Opitutus sp.]|nr:hypothetical protein [Opitutus sp.]